MRPPRRFAIDTVLLVGVIVVGIAGAALGVLWHVEVECPWCDGSGSWLASTVDADGREHEGRIRCRGCRGGRVKLLWVLRARVR